MNDRPPSVRDVLERSHRLGMIGGDLEEQLAHCAGFSFVLAQLFGESGPGQAIDMGTGGGLPGLALAAEWTDTDWVLVDQRSSRASEVERSTLRLGLAARTRVIARAVQQMAHETELREQADVVVARSFGPPAITAECATGLLAVGGHLIVSEPPDATPARWSPPGLATCGLDHPRPFEHAGHHFVALTKIRPAPVRLPRLPPRADRGWPS